jgi:hypothetical protein
VTGHRAIVLAALLLAIGPQSAAARVLPFAAHEIRLGTPLAQFRELDRFADLDPGERLVCSNDPPSSYVYQVRPPEELVEAGAIGCALVPVTDDPAPDAATMEMFGERVKASFTFYQAKGEREPRLTQMLVVMSNRRFENIAGLFRRTYGDAARIDVTGGMLVSGASMSNMVYTWENPLSTIQLDMYSITIDRARATFIYRTWWEELLETVRRIRFGE